MSERPDKNPAAEKFVKQKVPDVRDAGDPGDSALHKRSGVSLHRTFTGRKLPQG
jgi:hypothetical protein